MSRPPNAPQACSISRRRSSPRETSTVLKRTAAPRFASWAVVRLPFGGNRCPPAPRRRPRRLAAGRSPDRSRPRGAGDDGDLAGEAPGVRVRGLRRGSRGLAPVFGSSIVNVSLSAIRAPAERCAGLVRGWRGFAATRALAYATCRRRTTPWRGRTIGGRRIAPDAGGGRRRSRFSAARGSRRCRTKQQSNNVSSLSARATRRCARRSRRVRAGPRWTVARTRAAPGARRQQPIHDGVHALRVRRPGTNCRKWPGG